MAPADLSQRAAGRGRVLARTAWIYGRHELLYLCWASMEVALLAPLILSALGWARYWSPVLLALWLLAVILLPFNLNRLLTIAEIPLPRQRWYVLLAFLLTLLFALRTLLYEPASPFDFRWLGRLFTHFVEPDNPLWGRDLAVFFLVALLWWRGIALTGRRVDIHDIGLRLRVGGLLLAPVVIGASALYDTQVTPFILLFFFSALLAVSLTRAEQIAREQEQRNYPIRPRWLAVIAGTTLATVLLALLLALGLGGQNIVAWLEPVWIAFRLGLIVVVSTFSYLLFLLLAPLGWLLNALAGRMQLPSLPEIQMEVFQTMETAVRATQVQERSDWQGVALLWLDRLLVLLLLAAVCAALYLALSRFLSGRRLAPASEELGSGPGRQQLERPGWGARLLSRLNFWQQQRAAASVRRVYRQMVAAAAGSGYPRTQAETPYEYLGSLAEVWPAGREEAELITRAYVRVRYGELPEAQAEVEEIAAAWRRLQALPPAE